MILIRVRIKITIGNQSWGYFMIHNTLPILFAYLEIWRIGWLCSTASNLHTLLLTEVKTSSFIISFCIYIYYREQLWKRHRWLYCVIRLRVFRILYICKCKRWCGLILFLFKQLWSGSTRGVWSSHMTASQTTSLHEI